MIGILGGTFDPIHYGHLRSAIEIREHFNLDHVRLIPCAQPAHRQQPLTSPALRAAMVELAIAPYSGLVCDRQELIREGASYTIDTLLALRAQFPKETLLLSIGEDAFAHFTHWHRWQAIFDYAHLIVLTRPGCAIDWQSITQSAFFSARRVDCQRNLHQQRAGLVYCYSVTPLAISATAIRALSAQGRNTYCLLPDAVVEFISQHQLYQN